MNPLGRAREEAELFELRYRDSLGSVICEVLRQWRKEAEEGTIDERQVDNALRSENGLRNHNLRVKQASENYNLPVDLIREFWGMRKTGPTVVPGRSRIWLEC